MSYTETFVEFSEGDEVEVIARRSKNTPGWVRVSFVAPEGEVLTLSAPEATAHAIADHLSEQVNAL